MPQQIAEESLAERVERVLPTVSAHRDDAEAARRMAPAVREAVGGQGLFVMAAPIEAGGAGESLRHVLEAVEQIAEADPTVAWHVLNSGVAGLLGARLGPDELAVVFADRTRPFGNGAVPQGRARPVEGGYSLNGEWPFVTGGRDASWFALAGFIETPDQQPGVMGSTHMRTFLVPAHHVTALDTFSEASAMRGTGSHGCRCDAVFVRDSFALAGDAPLQSPEPFFCLPRSTTFAPSVAMVQIGVLRYAIDAVADAIHDRRSRADGSAHTDWPRVQQTLANAEAAWSGMRNALLVAADGLWDEVTSAGTTSTRQRAKYYAATWAAIDGGRHHVSELYSIATSSAFVSLTPIDRAMRDAHAISAGAEVARFLQYEAGRVLAGGNPTHPAF